MARRTYHVTYDIVTPESAEDGDYAESGWVDAHDDQCQAPDGCVGQAYIDWCATQDLDHTIEPDEYDIEEHEGDESAAAVALMLGVLRDAGACEFSSGWHFDTYGSYSASGEMDMYNGSTTSKTFHFEAGWTDEEKRAIFDAVTRRQR